MVGTELGGREMEKVLKAFAFGYNLLLFKFCEEKYATNRSKCLYIH